MPAVRAQVTNGLSGNNWLAKLSAQKQLVKAKTVKKASAANKQLAPAVVRAEGKKTPPPAMPSHVQSLILQQRIEEQENRVKVFESVHYTQFIRDLGQELSSMDRLAKHFGGATKERFGELFNSVHEIFKRSRVENHKSKCP